MTSLTSSSADQYAFGGSEGPATDVQLWLGYYTEPVMKPVFTGSPVNLGSGEFQFTLTGTTGSTNEIQASFDFQRWDFITDVILNGGTATFFYTNDSPVAYRYFRAEPLQ
jgi:hypothetical protein